MHSPMKPLFRMLRCVKWRPSGKPIVPLVELDVDPGPVCFSVAPVSADICCHVLRTSPRAIGSKSATRRALSALASHVYPPLRAAWASAWPPAEQSAPQRHLELSSSRNASR